MVDRARNTAACIDMMFFEAPLHRKKCGEFQSPPMSFEELQNVVSFDDCCREEARYE